jgi:hypothetical protein
MIHFNRLAYRLFVAAVAAGAVACSAVTSAEAGGSCSVKAAEGTGGTEETAKFQVYEALLQATDWGAWAAWMANGSTPGYKVGPVKYKCGKGGLGVSCRGQANICKL